MMTRTAELLAARGGTMTAEKIAEIRDCFSDRCGPSPAEVMQMLRHITVQGSKVAALEAERDEWRGVAQSRLAHERQMQSQLEALRAELARLKPSGQVAELVERVEALMGPPCAVQGEGQMCDTCDGHAALAVLAALAQRGQAASGA